ncbi:siderophore-interacting protein [Actinomadura barringtoniae]|nr:siderophore-interacting protein [Actinomadura barringtoniae]
MFDFFDLQVVRTQRISPSLMRITYGGDLDTFVTGGRDQRFKLFLPHPHQETPVVPRSEDWFAEWRALDPAERGVMRSYTVREARPGEVDVDFVLHGPAGPAGTWAAEAKVGDRVVILGPTAEENGGFDFHPPEGTRTVLLAGDETALPAIAGNLAWLPSQMRALVWIEVPHTGDHQNLPTRADADITWLPSGSLLDTVRAADLPDSGLYAWIAGEASTIRALRRHLVNERGMDRRSVTFTGYWRRGAAEEDLLAEVMEGKDPHTGED